MVSLYFFLSPQRYRISHRRQCASLLHWNLTIPPSLWPDRELRKYHCPCLALTPPPVAIRHLLLRNRYRPDGLHGVQSKARPNRNVPEEWVFSFQGTSGLSSLQSKFNKNPPVSRWPRRRTLVVLAGLPTVRFDFSVFYTAGLGQINTPLVSQRGIKDDSILFSVNWYPFISWWPFESRLMYQKSKAHLSKSDKLYSSLGIFAVLRYPFMAFTKSCGLLKYCFTKSYDFTSCIRRFVLQNSLGFFQNA